MHSLQALLAPSRRWVPWMVRTSRSVRNAVWAAQWFFVSSLNEAFSAAISQGFNMFQPKKKGGWTMTYHDNDWNGVRDSENLRNVGGIGFQSVKLACSAPLGRGVTQFHTDLFSYFSFWGFERHATQQWMLVWSKGWGRWPHDRLSDFPALKVINW